MSDELCPGCPGDPNETCCKPELRVKVWMDKQKADMSEQKAEQKTPVMVCKTCIHAEFLRTPTGRIKRAYAGRCKKQNELTRLVKECAAPCVQVAAYRIAIWPDTNASSCNLWQAAARTQEPRHG